MTSPQVVSAHPAAVLPKGDTVPAQEPLLGVDDVRTDVLDHPPGARTVWARRAGYGVLALVLLAAATNLLGPRTGHASATGGDHSLRLTYPQVTRAGQTAPLDLEITAPSGFDGPVRVRLCRHFFDDVDLQGWHPTPTSETSDREGVVHEFAPPTAGDTLRVTLDARTGTGRFGALETCEVALMSDDAAVLQASFTTWRLP